MIAVDLTNRLSETSLLKKEFRYFKFLGEYEEYVGFYDSCAEYDKIFPIVTGYCMEYSFANFDRCAGGESLNDKIFEKIKVQPLTEDNSFSDAKCFGESLREESDFSKSVDTAYEVYLLDTGEIIAGCVDYSSDKSFNRGAFVARLVQKCRSENIGKETPVIVICATEKERNGLKKTLGEPAREVIYSDFIGLEENVDLLFSKGSKEAFVTDNLQKKEVSNYGEALSNYFASEVFASMSKRAQNNTEMLKKLAIGGEVSKKTAENLQKYCAETYNGLVSEGRSPVKLSKIVDWMSEKSSEDEEEDERYFLVNARRDKETFEAFEDLYPKNVDISESTMDFGAADSEGRAVGLMQVSTDEVFYTIEWLYVHPDVRRRGIATYLVKRFVDNLSATTNIREVQALFYDDNSDVFSFFSSLDSFDVSRECREIEIEADELENNALLEKLSKTDMSNVRLFASQDPQIQNEFIEEMKDMDMYAVLDKKDWLNSLLEEMSFCIIKDYKVAGAALVRECDENMLELMFLYGSNPVFTQKILGRMYKKYCEKYRGYGMKMFLANDNCVSMADKLFKGAAITRQRYKADWNYE